jgi:hypothetical protein
MGAASNTPNKPMLDATPREPAPQPSAHKQQQQLPPSAPPSERAADARHEREDDLERQSRHDRRAARHARHAAASRAREAEYARASRVAASHQAMLFLSDNAPSCTVAEIREALTASGDDLGGALSLLLLKSAGPDDPSPAELDADARTLANGYLRASRMLAETHIDAPRDHDANSSSSSRTSSASPSRPLSTRPRSADRTGRGEAARPSAREATRVKDDAPPQNGGETLAPQLAAAPPALVRRGAPPPAWLL